MPPQDFDELAKALASRSLSRRDALRWVGAALLGGMLGSSALGKAQAKEKPFPKCKEDAQCPTGTTCVSKECVTSEGCPPGQTLCNGTCVDTNTDLFNCGACGNQCGGGQPPCCVGGQCFGYAQADPSAGDLCFCSGGSECPGLENADCCADDICRVTCPA